MPSHCLACSFEYEYSFIWYCILIVFACELFLLLLAHVSALPPPVPRWRMPPALQDHAFYFRRCLGC